MTEQAVETGTAFAEYIALLLRLETLRQQGLSDSPEADDVRDLMDGPWYQLTAEEDERARGISGDLFMLTDEEVYARVPPEQREADWLRPLINQATEAGDHWRRLDLFRHGPTFIDRAGLAFVRGRSYEQVGLPEVTVLFYDLAWRESGDQTFRAFTVQLLEALGRWDEALGVADEVLSVRTADPFLLAAVGETLLMAHHRRHPSAPEDAVTKAREAYRRADRALRHEPGTRAAQIRATAQAGLATICHLHGKRDAAIRLWTEAIADWPDNPVLLVQRGAALYRVDLQRSSADFARAIELGSQIVQPYWYLANIALNTGDADRCVEFCRRARQLTQDPAYVGRAFEWEAIAEHSRGASPDSVLALFEQAERLLPGDETVAHNREAILQGLAPCEPLERSCYRSALPLVDAAASNDVRASAERWTANEVPVAPQEAGLELIAARAKRDAEVRALAPVA
ncbi:MAG: hypothetical protein HYU66_07800 [Armatimonadetes bacterium]|nr:hypothetical protein [Armatimonadota bacterium]